MELSAHGLVLEMVLRCNVLRSLKQRRCAVVSSCLIKVAGGADVLVDSVMRQRVGVTVGSVEIVSDNM